MPTLGVVEPLNVVKDIRPGFVPRLVPRAEKSFDVKRREETLNFRIVPALTAPTHAAGDSLIDQQALEVFAGVLVALVGVMHQRWGLAPSPQCRH